MNPFCALYKTDISPNQGTIVMLDTDNPLVLGLYLTFRMLSSTCHMQYKKLPKNGEDTWYMMGRLDINTLDYTILYRLHASRENSNDTKQPCKFWEENSTLVLYIMALNLPMVIYEHGSQQVMSAWQFLYMLNMVIFPSHPSYAFWKLDLVSHTKAT